MKMFEIHITLLSFSSWFRIHAILNKSPDFSCQNLWNKGWKGIKSCLEHSIFKNFLGSQCFFLDVFIRFCSASKALSNRIETRVVGDQNKTLWRLIPVNNNQNIHILRNCRGCWAIFDSIFPICLYTVL